MIELATLGHCGIFRDGVELTTLGSQKQKFALLVYLAAEGPVPRDRLLSIFWPERDREKASHSLSQALYSLKRDLGEECVSLLGDTVEVSAACRLDAVELESALAQQDWERSLQLYQGPFLEKFTLPGAPDFEEWAYRRRTRLAGQARRGFRGAIEARLKAGEGDAALAVGARWARLEPLEDEAQHAYIVLLARAGDRTGALQHYDAYCDRLSTELGVQPLEKTKALIEAIGAGRVVELPPPLGSADVSEPAETAVAAASGPAIEPAARASDEGDGDPVRAEAVAPEPRKGWSALWAELRARPVVQVGLVYLGAAWFALQLTEILTQGGILPAAAVKVVFYVLAALLPLALLLAWLKEQRSSAATVRVSWPRRLREGSHKYLLHALVGLVLVLGVGYVAAKRFINPPLDLAHQEERLAVLPFTDLSTGGELGAFTDALSEFLTLELSQLDPLWVHPTAALRRFRNVELTEAIADSLGVDVIVHGTVFGDGESASVTVSLIEVEGFKTRGLQVQGAPTEPPLLPGNELTDSIAIVIRDWLGQRHWLRELRAGTRSDKAWERFRQASDEEEDARKVAAAGDITGAKQMLDRADRYLKEAEDADRSWIDPIVQRGWVATQQARLAAAKGRSYDADWTHVGLEHANRALKKNETYARALELRGVLLDYLASESDTPAEADSLRVEAERVLRLATEVDERRALAWTRLTRILDEQGRLHEALIAAEHAYEADAFQLYARFVLFRLCYTSLQVRDWEAVTSWCGEGRARFPKRSSFVSAQLAALAGPEGPEPDAKLAWELGMTQLELIRPHRRAHYRPPTLMQYAAVLARAGLADSARAVIRRAREEDDSQNPETLIQEANARLRLGETSETVLLLRLYVELRPAGRQKLAADWWWDSLRDHPGFQALIAEPTE